MSREFDDFYLTDLLDELSDQILEDQDEDKYIDWERDPITGETIPPHWLAKCSEDYIDWVREHIDEVDWDAISIDLKECTIDFVREFKDRIDWGWIQDKLELSDRMQREFREELEKSVPKKDYTTIPDEILKYLMEDFK